MGGDFLIANECEEGIFFSRRDAENAEWEI